MIHYFSVIIPLVVLIPNLIWYFLPPNTIPQDHSGNAPAIPLFFEQVGRIGVFSIPLFYKINLNSMENKACLLLMLVSLFIYYFGWYRYYTKNRKHTLLFQPILLLPIPMAVTPVVYFILSAKILNSAPMLLASLSLAFGHLFISYNEFKKLNTQQ